MSVINFPILTPNRYREIYNRFEEIRSEFASLKSHLSLHSTLLVKIVISTKQDFLVLVQNNEQALENKTCIKLMQELQIIEIE